MFGLGEQEEPDGENGGVVAEERLGEEEADEMGFPKIPCSKMPYRSLDLMFNHANIWVNKQDPSPGKIWFDLWRPSYWFQFSPINYAITPCFVPKANGQVLKDMEQVAIKQDIIDKVYVEVTVFRGSRNLNTRWNKDSTLIIFLEKGLELVHQLETSRDEDRMLADAKLRDWRNALFKKLPSQHRLRGNPIHFNIADAKTIGDTVVSKCDFIECRHQSATFACGVFIKCLPGELVSVYVYLLVVQKIGAREMRLLKDQKAKAVEKAGKKKKKKNHCRKRC